MNWAFMLWNQFWFNTQFSRLANYDSGQIDESFFSLFSGSVFLAHRTFKLQYSVCDFLIEFIVDRREILGLSAMLRFFLLSVSILEMKVFNFNKSTNFLGEEVRQCYWSVENMLRRLENCWSIQVIIVRQLNIAKKAARNFNPISTQIEIPTGSLIFRVTAFAENQSRFIRQRHSKARPKR